MFRPDTGHKILNLEPDAILNETFGGLEMMVLFCMEISGNNNGHKVDQAKAIYKIW